MQVDTSWSDGNHTLWLWGCCGSVNGGYGAGWNTIWKYDTQTGMWTWVSGGTVPPNYGAKGVYGTQGVPDALNMPGGRYYASGWMDRKGNLWLFGGFGFDSAGGTVF